MMEELDEVRQLRLEKNLILAGDLDESLTPVKVSAIFKETMNVDIDPAQIDNLYQIANTEKRGRVYKVLFSSLKAKELNYGSRTKLGNKKIYLNEDLTSRREKVAYLARDLKRKRMITNTWTRNGEIFIREIDSERAVIITDVIPDENNPKIKVKGSQETRDISIKR